MNMNGVETERNVNQCLFHATAWQMSYLPNYCPNHPVIRKLPSYLRYNATRYKRAIENVKDLGREIQKSQAYDSYRQQSLRKYLFIPKTNRLSTCSIYTVLFDNVNRPSVGASSLNNTRRRTLSRTVCSDQEISFELPTVVSKIKARIKTPSPFGFSNRRNCYGQIYSREMRKKRPSRSIIKPEYQKVVLVADPAYVQFHNFKSNKLYQKSLMLRNVSCSPARFQLEGRPYRSRFMIAIDSRSESDIIPPGMAVKLIVYFSCDDMYEPEEQLVINVLNGKPVIIRLHGCRDPPILKAIATSDVQLTPAEAYRTHSDTTVSLSETYLGSESLIRSEQSMSFSDVGKESLDNLCSDVSIIHRGISQTIFECQQCFVGEEITRKITFKNVGGDARFFIMSEMDWCSMHIEDVTRTNVLVLPTFAIQPAYFSLKAQEEIPITMYFFPDSYGMHVDTLFLTSDNSSVISTEIMGDGVMYEPDFFQFSEKLTRVARSDTSVTSCPRYYLHLGEGTANDILSKVFYVMNTSDAHMYYRWDKQRAHDANDRDSSIKYECSEDFPPDNIDISPSEGIFPPLSVLHFSVTAEVPDLLTSRHFAILQFYVEDIPLASVAKKLQLLIQDSRVKRRTCLTSVDIRVGDVEVWIQCVPTDIIPCGDAESDTFCECVSGFVPGSQTDMSTISQYWLYANSAIMCDEMSQDEQRSQLTIQEGFDFYEVVLTESITCHMSETVISMGILIPDGPLFVGIEQTYTLIMKNISRQPVSYTWGQPTGFDESKMQIRLCPRNGEIPAGDIRILEVVCLPIEAGPIEHLSVPCYIGTSKNIIILEIECVTESFHVTFYLPPPTQNPKGLSDVLRAEWHVNSRKTPVDLSKIHESFPHKASIHGILCERELMSIVLDGGDALKEAYVGPSVISVSQNSKELSTTSDGVDIIRQVSETEFSSEQSENCFKERSGSECEGEAFSSSHDPKHIIPYHVTLPPPITESMIIEFLELPLRTARKRTIVIKNETPIPSTFSISVRNFYPVRLVRTDVMKETVNDICKKVFERKDDDIWSKLKQPESGMLVCVEPNKAQLGPYEIVPIEVYVFADTWGLYTDELQINITGLPQYTIAICVQVNELPISYPICESTSMATPIVRFGTLTRGANAESRKLLLNNTSVLPLSINWYSFLAEPLRTNKSADSQVLAPFNVVLHMYTPVTDELAVKLKTPTENSNERLLKSSIERYESGESLRFLEMFHPLSVSDSTDKSRIGSNTREDMMNHTTCLLFKNYRDSDALTWPKAYSVCSSGYEMPSENVEGYGEFSEKSEVSTVPSLFKPNRFKNTEFDISLAAFYGVPGSKYLSVLPEEIFIPPKGKSSITLTIIPDKCPITDGNGSLICKIIGFIRIAPSDKRKDGCYSRQDGIHLQPLEVKIETKIARSRISYDIPKCDRTFSISADAVMRYPNKLNVYLLKRTYTFYNTEDGIIYMNLEINKPFRVTAITRCTESPSCERAGFICVGGREKIQVEISCCVTAKFIKELMEYDMGRNSQSSVIKVNGSLFITYADKSTQVLDLILKVQLPALNLSSYKLNFGSVHVGDTKKLILLVENHSAYVQNFRVRKKNKNEEFNIDHDTGEIPIKPINGHSTFAITVSFTPRSPTESTDKLEILTYIPNYSEECILIGQGSLDERYHLPGM